MPRVIAVTGATGALGRRVVPRLAGREDVALRLVVREAARAPRVPDAEVAAVPGGYADGPGLTAALPGGEGQPQQGPPALAGDHVEASAREGRALLDGREAQMTLGDAPPAVVVWSVVTEPGHLSGWFSDEVEIELRPGGVMLLTWPEREQARYADENSKGWLTELDELRGYVARVVGANSDR